MYRILRIVSVFCTAIGAIWFLQGIGVLPGSFMTGQQKWAIYGGLLFVAGFAIRFAIFRLKRR